MIKHQDIEELRQLKRDTDVFVQRAFDWVSTLEQRAFLAHLYGFQTAIDEKIKECESLGAQCRS